MNATVSPQQAKTVASLWLDAESHHVADLVLAHLDNARQFPRDLQLVATLHFPIQLKEIAGLTVRSASNWFLARNRASAFEGEDRPLHGCCYTTRGHGALFIDANDDPAERRFTFAHEFSHYLLDHYLPRQNALQFFGPTIEPVLNGERPATILERFRSVRMHLPIGAMSNLMERSRDPNAAYEIAKVEARVDRLALALLAPADVVLADLPIAPYADQLALLAARLQNEFGLPAQIGALYADALLLALGRAPARFSRRGAQ